MVVCKCKMYYLETEIRKMQILISAFNIISTFIIIYQFINQAFKKLNL